MAPRSTVFQTPWFKPAAFVAAWAGLLLLLLVSLWLIAADLGDEPDSRASKAGDTLQASLAVPLASGDNDQLRAAIRALQKNQRLGLLYLRIRRANGQTVATTGRFDSWTTPVISSEVFRAWLYGLLSTDRQLSLQLGGQRVGSVDYGLAWIMAGGDGNGTQWLGLVALLVSVPLLIWVTVRLPFLLSEAMQGSSQQQPRTAAGPVAPKAVGPVSPRSLARGTESGRPAAPPTELILESLDAGVISVDREGRIAQINLRAAKLAGGRQAELRREAFNTVFSLISPSGSPWQLPVAEVFGGRATRPEDLSLRGSQGGSVSVVVQASPVRDRTNAVVLVSVLIREVIERGRDSFQQQARMMTAALRAVEDAVLAVSADGRITYANAAANARFGGKSRSLQNQTVKKLFPANRNSGRSFSKLVNEVRATLVDPEGNEFQVELQAEDLTGGEGQLLRVIDVARLRSARNNQARLGQILQHSAEEVLIFNADNLRFVEVSHSVREKLGFSQEKFQSMTLLDICDKLEPQRLRSHLEELRSGRSREVFFQTRFMRSSGNAYLVDVRLSYTGDEDPPTFLAIALDPEERMHATADVDEDRLIFLAYYDSLTGLPSRLLFMDRLRQARLHAQRNNACLLVAVLSVAGLHDVNRRLGYETGDRLLKDMALWLQRQIGDDDILARVSTDFLLCMQAERPDGLATACESLLDQARAFLSDSDAALHVQLASGYTVFPEDSADGGTLLEHALVALEADAEARSVPRRYASVTDEPAPEAGVDPVSELRRAITEDQFRAGYTSLIRRNSRAVAGVVVSPVWQHLESLPADVAHFTALLHRANLTGDLTLWLTRKVCKAARNWRDLNIPQVPIVLDIMSMEPFREETISVLLRELAQHELDAGQVMVGVSQDAAVNNPRWLQLLTDAGIGVYLRDLGEGPSVASRLPVRPRLAELSAGACKGLPDSGQAVTRIKQLIGMGKAMDAELVIPATASEGAHKLLQALGCSFSLVADEENGGAAEFGVTLSRSGVDPSLVRAAE